MFSCKLYQKHINKLHISKLTAQRNTRKLILTFKDTFFQTFLFSNIQRIQYNRNIVVNIRK